MMSDFNPYGICSSSGSSSDVVDVGGVPADVVTCRSTASFLAVSGSTD